MRLLDIPGYAEAVKLERDLRDFAALGATERVAGFELRPITLRDILLLEKGGNAFFSGGREPNAGDVLHLIKWQSAERIGWLKFRALRAVLSNEISLGSAVEQIGTWIDHAFLDMPPSSQGRKSDPSPVSVAVTCVDILASNYGWAEKAILDMPVASMFQYIRAISSRVNREAVSFNKYSDKIRGNYIRERNRQQCTSTS